jgi:NADH-quinone oxidoreductase subunit G
MQAQNLEPRLGPFDPDAVLREIQRVLPSYRSSHTDFSGSRGIPKSEPLDRADIHDEAQLILTSNDGLFSSGTLGNYCDALNSVSESGLLLPYEQATTGKKAPAEPKLWTDPGTINTGA